MNRRSYLIFLTSLGFLALFPLAPPFSSSMMDSSHEIIRTIPREIGSWRGRDLPVDERTYQILETRNVLSRQYENSGRESVQLLIVSSDKDRRVAHPPEVCYLTSNFAILDERVESFPWRKGFINLKRFVAQDPRNPSIQEKVLYVYKVGNRYTSNYFAQQFFFAWDRATRRESKIILIRLSGWEEAALNEFLPQVLAYLP